MMRSVDVESVTLGDDGTFPNNEELPVLVYRKALDPAELDAEKVFQRNGWGGTWRNGIYSYHHYHGTAHEVLGVVAGHVLVRLGGERGRTFQLEAGDVIVLPAGVAHKNLGSSSDFEVVGAYPEGQEYDMNYGKPEERPQALENIRATPLPTTDPVYGARGPLVDQWLG